MSEPPNTGDPFGIPSQAAPTLVPKNSRMNPSMMPLERTINILIVDDSFIVRSGLKASPT